VNTQITFDEYYLLVQKNFLYEATFNPEVIYEHELNDLDPEDPSYAERAPELIIHTKEFKN